MHIPVFAVRLAAKTRAKAPLLLAINGGVLVVKACYDFYKAAPKCKEIMDEYRAFEEEIENSKIAAETKAVTKDYTEKDAKRDHAQNMLRTAIAFVKVFAPGAIDLLAAFGSFGYSYKILNGRYVAVAARSASQSKYIDHLEKGIMAAYGADALHKIQHGDPEAPADVGNDGEAVSEEDKEIPPRKPTQILFTDGNPNFEDDPFKNRNFIVGMQNRLNDVLVARQKGDKPGWLTLNEIKTALGEPITGKDAKETFANAVQVRRAALKNQDRTFGYPSIVNVASLANGDLHTQVALASMFVLKYASIILMQEMTYATALPLYGLRQNIFTDPQKPMRVEPGIYPLNGADENAPCAVTTDFALTYFLVSGELERSGVPVNLLISDGGGYSVLTSWAAGKFSAGSIDKFLKEQDIEGKIKSRTLIIPGKVAVLKGELEEKLPGWDIKISPNEASGLVKFMKDL